ncbi:hypothetical protein M434DRAFT_29733 [Hypoxylon sp. CO27-5]|nr:hypothetical protein M434DRAFT_29733 [Hypoxylon sp. CO27-5]
MAFVLDQKGKITDLEEYAVFNEFNGRRSGSTTTECLETRHSNRSRGDGIWPGPRTMLMDVISRMLLLLWVESATGFSTLRMAGFLLDAGILAWCAGFEKAQLQVSLLIICTILLPFHGPWSFKQLMTRPWRYTAPGVVRSAVLIRNERQKTSAPHESGTMSRREMIRQLAVDTWRNLVKDSMIRA